MDLPVTLLGLLGQEIPEYMSGNDLSSYLTGEKPQNEAPAYTLSSRLQAHPEHKRKMESGRPGNFMIRGKGWKYIEYHDGREFLYNLTADPEELENLSDHPDHQGKKVELKKELTAFLKKTNYTF